MSSGKYLKYVSLAVALVLTACSSSGPRSTGGGYSAGTRQEVPRAVFNPSEIKQGRAVSQLVGRAYLGDYHSYGDRVAVGVDVILNPVSGASNQWYNEVCRRGNVLTGPIDERYRARIRTVRTDHYGQYVFTDVPQGEYYLSARMYWIDKEPFSGPVQYGGLVAKKIKLDEAIETIDLNDFARCQGYFK